MIAADVIARLREVATPPLALVEGAVELAALGTGTPLALPAAYVGIAEEASSENERVTGVLQRTEIDVSVLLVLGNVSDSRGAAAGDELEQLKVAVRTALIGWQPPSADDIVTHVGGRIVRFRDGTVWWEMTLATALYLEAL